MIKPVEGVLVGLWLEISLHALELNHEALQTLIRRVFIE